MSYDRQWLRDQLASQLRDSTLGDQADVLIDMAVKKINVVLESTENEQLVTLTVSNNPHPLPDDLSIVRSLTTSYGDGGYALKSVPLHRIREYGSGGNAMVYAVAANELWLGPFAAGDYQLVYFREMDLASDANATDAALERYPFLFREAVLAEGYAWKEDGAAAQIYEARWLGSAREINRVSRRLRQGDAPAMRAS